MVVQRWTLYEPVTGSTYTVEINPNEGGTPGYERALTVSSTLAGATVAMEGEATPQRIECSGAILDRSHLAGLAGVFKARRQVLLTDDLGRQWWVYPESFTPDRKRSRREWRHDYQMRFLILDTVSEFGTP